MKTNKKIQALIAMTLAMASVTAFAGSEGGNGGGLLFCPGSSSQQMYDLWEGAVRFEHVYIPSIGLTHQQYVEQALTKVTNLDPTLSGRIRAQIKYLSDAAHFRIIPDITLPLVPDAHILLMKEGCEYRQLADWDSDTNAVLVNKQYFDSLDEFSKAALYLHEAIYKVDRDLNGAMYSDLARKIVGKLLSVDLFTGDDVKSLIKDDDVQVAPGISSPQVEVVPNAYFSGFFDLRVFVGDLDVSKLQGPMATVEWHVPQAEKMDRAVSDLTQQLNTLKQQGVSRRQIRRVQKMLDAAQGDRRRFAYDSNGKFEINKNGEGLSIGSNTIPLDVDFKVQLADANKTVLTVTMPVPNDRYGHVRFDLFQNAVVLK